MKQKGFTLIEILAVLAILSVIMLITVPAVNIILEDSRQNTFRISLESLLKVIKNDYQGNVRYGEVIYELNDNTLVCTSGCPEGKITIKYKGELEAASGTVKVNGVDIVMDISTDAYQASYKQEKCVLEDFQKNKSKCEVVKASEEIEKCGSNGNNCTLVEMVVIEKKENAE